MLVGLLDSLNKVSYKVTQLTMAMNQSIYDTMLVKPKCISENLFIISVVCLQFSKKITSRQSILALPTLGQKCFSHLQSFIFILITLWNKMDLSRLFLTIFLRQFNFKFQKVKFFNHILLCENNLEILILNFD